MEIEDVLIGYIEAAIWADMPEDDSCGNIDEVAPESLELAKTDIAQFLCFAKFQLPIYPCDAAQMGHDIWLTRNGHGAGFWDRTELEGDLGQILTQYAEDIGPREIYRGDDDLIYIS